ncbi:MAG: HAD family hydrolase [Oscillospiraceae bacterium]
MSDIEWIFLDMGGTFVDETAAWEDRIRRTAAANEIPILVDGTLIYGTNDEVRKSERFREEMERAAAENLPEYPTAMQRFGIRYKERWNHELERLYAGAEDVLQRLHERYRLGVIANQPKNARERLEQFGVLKYFDHLTISGEIGFSKPSLTIFRETLRMTGTTADKCFMVGDRLTNDIAPAKEQGFRTVWVKQEYGGMNSITDDSMKPDFMVESISALPEIFLK